MGLCKYVHFCFFSAGGYIIIIMIIITKVFIQSKILYVASILSAFKNNVEYFIVPCGKFGSPYPR